MNNIKEKLDLLKFQIDEAYQSIEYLQTKCPHPKEFVIKIPVLIMAGIYQYNCQCTQCDKKWRENGEINDES